MSDALVATRFAPSPSGALHLGNARTALFNFLLARRHAGRFVLRVEDTDAARVSEPLIEGLCSQLRWLGLQWDEGPDRAGPYAPYRQSQRAGLYEQHFQRLERADRVYPCFCSARELELARRAQLAAGRPPRYAGGCDRLSAAERAARLAAGRRPSLRFRVGAGRRIEFDDLVHGAQSTDSDSIGDFIVRREDGSAGFLFSNAVDDALMGISHVLRGEDHLTNTPRQLLLLEALGLPAPRYGHVSLLLGPDGTPLSKRTGATSLTALSEQGYAPGAVANYLFRLGHSSALNEVLDGDAMAQAFELSHLQRAPAHFDATQLRHWQSLWVRSLSPVQAERWLAPVLPADLSSPRRAAFVRAVLPNVLLTEEARQWRRIVFDEGLEYDPPALAAAREAGPQFFMQAAAAVHEHASLGELGQATGRKGAALFRPLRAALTGRLHGPELAALLLAMPPELVRSRLLHFARP